MTDQNSYPGILKMALSKMFVIPTEKEEFAQNTDIGSSLIILTTE